MKGCWDCAHCIHYTIRNGVLAANSSLNEMQAILCDEESYVAILGHPILIDNSYYYCNKYKVANALERRVEGGNKDKYNIDTILSDIVKEKHG